jgi:hypothetical protein
MPRENLFRPTQEIARVSLKPRNAAGNHTPAGTRIAARPKNPSPTPRVTPQIDARAARISKRERAKAYDRARLEKQDALLSATEVEESKTGAGSIGVVVPVRYDHWSLNTTRSNVPMYPQVGSLFFRWQRLNPNPDSDLIATSESAQEYEFEKLCVSLSLESR